MLRACRFYAEACLKKLEPWFIQNHVNLQKTERELPEVLLLLQCACKLLLPAFQTIHRLVCGPLLGVQVGTAGKTG